MNLDQAKLANKTVVLRCDLNVPLQNGQITDDGRIRAALPTIEKLLSNNCKIVLIAHLGRPKGERKPELSLLPVAQRLRELTGRTVHFSEKITGADTHVLNTGEIMLLENIRYEAAETSKVDAEREALAEELAKYGQFYVGDGFGAVHRKHASVYELAKRLPHATGYLIEAEVTILQKLTQNPDRPYAVVLGGAKVSDKLGVISHLLERVNLLAIGGGMAFTFLAAQGFSVGKSLVEQDQIDTVKGLIARAAELNVKLLLPVDVVVAPEFKADAPATTVAADQIPADQIGLDIGPKSSALFASAIANCKTVFWNGPMGVFEFANFQNGTKQIATALTQISGISVVGGGDSAAAVRQLGFKDEMFGYISTGGGASLEYLEGKSLPGLAALD
jgi:phosphoglycerate kinase